MSEGTLPEHRTLHGLLGEVAHREPDRIALREARLSLTFADFWTRTGRLACLLVASGVREGDVVVVALPRSIDMVLACFATFRAGAVALPLDLRVPPARNRKLVERTGARWSLFRGSQIPECVDRSGAVRLDGPWPGGSPEGPRTRAGDDAVLVFTSGSTGEPKGVRLSHGALVVRAETEKAAYDLGPDDTYFFRTSPAFVGLSVALALLAGGVTVAVAGDEEGEKAGALLALIPSLGVTFAPFAPRLLEALLDEPDPARGLASVRVLRSAGEALSAELARRLCAALPSCRLVDGYGTTETSGVILSADVSGPGLVGTDTEGGRPLAGVDLRLVGADGRPGREGEIWVSTPMLATGYLGGESPEDPRFIEEPRDGGGPPVRWYRTGDRGRLTLDGRIRVLGRIDLQLNIGGVRAEPFEIEGALRLHESVADAAVWMQPDASGRSRLVAYLVDRDKAAPAAALRGFLARLLPPPLIPARFLHVGALPLTPSGKVDRSALPLPETVERVAKGPRSDGEGKILALFREILKAPGLGVDDDFFEWGGDSLKAFALMSRICEGMGVRLPAAAILNAPTAGDLAREVARGDPGQVSTVWLRKASGLPPLVCLPGLAGDPLWFHPLIEALDRRQPMLGLSFVALKPPISIPAAAARAVEALRAEQPRGPYFLLGHSVGGVLAFEMARELARGGERVDFVGLIDTWVPGSRRVLPVSGAARAAKRLKRFRNRLIGSARERLKESLTRFGLGMGVRARVFIPGLREAALIHRLSACDLKVTLFRANERTLGADLGADWAVLARGGVEIVDIAGHHLNLITGGRARDLSARIAGAVSRALTSSSRASSLPSQ